MKKYQNRVIAEQKELKEKITKLADFLGTKTGTQLGQNERVLLLRQLNAMRIYSGLLKKRIDSFL